MTPIPTMLEPPIWLDLQHLRECQMRGCTICAELRHGKRLPPAPADFGVSPLRAAFKAWRLKKAMGL